VARWPEAIWQPVQQVGGALRPIAVCLHHQAGNGNPAPVYASRGVSAHFWLPRAGQPVQHVDSERQAWHGVAHNAYSLGVETEGCGAPPHAEPLSEHQLATFARLMAWAKATHGIPLVLSESVSQPGLNYHRAQGGPATGCPCDVRKNARAEILRRAQGAAPAPPPQVVHFLTGQETRSMALSTGPAGGRVDLLFVAGDSSVHHWWAADPPSLATEGRRSGESLGGQVRPGGGVSGGWTADKKYYVAACDGTDNRPYVNWHDGKGWSGWHPVGEPGMLRPA
jgi:hypothetical protein